MQNIAVSQELYDLARDILESNVFQQMNSYIQEQQVKVMCHVEISLV